MPLPLIAFALPAIAKGIGAIFGHSAQKKAAKANKKAALKNLDLVYDDLDARAAQERAAALQAQEAVGLEAGALEGQTATSAAAGNVQGATIDSLLLDVQRQEAAAKFTLATNLDNTIGQIDRQKRGAIAQAEDRIASVPKPSSGALALQLAGVGIDAYSQYKYS